MKISLILAWTVEILRRGLEGNEAEDGCENRHGRVLETEEEKEIVVVVLERNGEAIEEKKEKEKERELGEKWE